ncbi:MAG: hypothetical protein FWE41_08025 [Coriobacteriia bacterium]|nr:hypothetical protein [Coriobacteriia bacterium]
MDILVLPTLNNIKPPAPVSGSSTHDALQDGITASLEAWENLITSDANVITNAAMELDSVDNSISQKLLGTGAVT